MHRRLILLASLEQTFASETIDLALISFKQRVVALLPLGRPTERMMNNTERDQKFFGYVNNRNWTERKNDGLHHIDDTFPSTSEI